jgi:hypothetical protein
VDLFTSQVDIDATTIIIRNLSVAGQQYDVRLQWRIQSQSLNALKFVSKTEGSYSL